MERVYIETTFVSYLTARPSRDVVMAGHQQTTHDWWDTRRSNYELCVSQLVLDEASAGDSQAAQERLLVLRPMLVLETTAEALEEPLDAFAVTLSEALADTTPITDEVRRAKAGLRSRQVTLR